MIGVSCKLIDANKAKQLIMIGFVIVMFALMLAIYYIEKECLILELFGSFINFPF
jgi:uncharacterized membrane protein